MVVSNDFRSGESQKELIKYRLQRRAQVFVFLWTVVSVAKHSLSLFELKPLGPCKNIESPSRFVGCSIDQLSQGVCEDVSRSPLKVKLVSLYAIEESSSLSLTEQNSEKKTSGNLSGVNGSLYR